MRRHPRHANASGASKKALEAWSTRESLPKHIAEAMGVTRKKTPSLSLASRKTLEVVLAVGALTKPEIDVDVPRTTPQAWSALKEPRRRRFLRVYRAWSTRPTAQRPRRATIAGRVARTTARTAAGGLGTHPQARAASLQRHPARSGKEGPLALQARQWLESRPAQRLRWIAVGGGDSHSTGVSCSITKCRRRSTLAATAAATTARTAAVRVAVTGVATEITLAATAQRAGQGRGTPASGSAATQAATPAIPRPRASRCDRSAASFGEEKRRIGSRGHEESPTSPRAPAVVEKAGAALLY
ncbi:hypothetical protein HPB50_018256 [Hyalomma asiaticum]|uniref:Uncharacterized protein n=1 Tax=Hyalomma asiaticum TaxID=266040 RepID=A0ACB7SI81_HYAAI|nr:hypothetical protein HPB50_018256 [Hyalomma asiaticum]